MDSPDVAIIGAGAMGASCALACARLGASTVLLDRGEACSGTSARGAGVVNRLLWNPLDIALVTRAIHLFRDLDEASEGAFTFHDTGGLLLVDEARLARARESRRSWRAQGLAVEELGPDEVTDLPGCGALEVAHAERGFLVEGDGWCVTTDAVHAMVREAQRRGAQVRPNARATRIEPGSVTLESGERIAPRAIVIATGAWTPALLARGPWRPPLAAYRPQACLLSMDVDEAMPAVHDVVNHTYWRPEGSGKVLVGDGTVLVAQDVDRDPSVEPTFASGARDALAKRWPAAHAATLVRAWGGFEAGTPDRKPLAGEVPGLRDVYMLAGGNGFGFMRSPALGEAVGHLALRLAPPVPIKEYEPARFAEWDGRAFELREGFSL